MSNVDENPNSSDFIFQGAMGKCTRLPVEPAPNPTKHGQANTLAHGTHSACDLR